MKNIILIGMMGCGKTTCARLLGEKLGRPMVDTDRLVEAKTGKTIPELFEDGGESYFRDLESQIASELANSENLIIATGGGFPLKEENLSCLRKHSLVFWLNRDPKETYRQGILGNRPLAQEGEAAFVARYRQREPVYRNACDYEILCRRTPEETVNRILEVANNLVM